MGTATEGTLLKIHRELVGIRADMRARDVVEGRDQRVKHLADMALVHDPIPLRPDDIRREGPPKATGLRAEIWARLHDADTEAREHLPEPRPGHTWRVDLETSDTLTSTGRDEFSTALRLVYSQVRV